MLLEPDQNTAPASDRTAPLPSSSSPWAFALVLFGAAALFLVGIGSYQQLLRAEGPFALGARAVIESPDTVLVPHSPQERPLTRPPLQYWLIAGAYSVFGIGYGATRLPSALAALGVVMLVYLLGVRLYGPLVALTAGALLSTSYIFWSFSRLAMPDMLLTLCITGALTACTLLLTGTARRPRLVWWMGYAALAAGMLTKGPIGPVLGVLPVLLLTVVCRDLGVITRLRPVRGGLVFLLLTVPYYLLVWLVHGSEPLKTFFLDENLHRFSGTTWQTKTVPVLYEVTAFLGDFLPWSPLLLLAAVVHLARQWHWPSLREPGLLLVLWIAAPVLFFMLSRFKLDYYFLPAVPPAALLLAHALHDPFPVPAWARRLWIGLVAMLLVALGIVGWVGLDLIQRTVPGTALRWLPHVLAAVGALATVLALRQSVQAAVLAFAATLWAVAIAGYLTLVPAYARLQPVSLTRHLPRDAATYLSPNAAEWATDFTLLAPIGALPPLLRDIPEIGALLEKDPRSVAVVDDGGRRELERRGLSLRILGEAEAYVSNRLTLKSLLHPASQPLYVVTAATS